MYKKATKDEAALLAPRKSFQGSKLSSSNNHTVLRMCLGSGVKTTVVDKKNKEIAEMKRTQQKEEEALKKKEDKEKEKEREREEKDKEKEAKKQEEKRKEEESKRTRTSPPASCYSCFQFAHNYLRRVGEEEAQA